MINILSYILIGIGIAFMFIGILGLFRLPDFYTRLHAASLVDTMGIIFVIFGLALQTGFSLVLVKLVFILIFIAFASPLASHALAKAAYHGNVKASKE